MKIDMKLVSVGIVVLLFIPMTLSISGCITRSDIGPKYYDTDNIIIRYETDTENLIITIYTPGWYTLYLAWTVGLDDDLNSDVVECYADNAPYQYMIYLPGLNDFDMVNVIKHSG